jgi:hypothetical protein
MRVDLHYLGHSGVAEADGGLAMRLAPNLARRPVAFDGEVAHPVRFREAMSALHAVVVGDLRFKPKDKTAYEEWKKQQAIDEAQLRKRVTDEVTARELARRVAEPIAPDLEGRFRKQHERYWRARRQWAAELSRNDPAMFRALVP